MPVSFEMCIKLIGVARGSVRELGEDYADFLRQHKFEIWTRDDRRTFAVRNYARRHSNPREYVEKCEVRSDETTANIMLTLIHQLMLCLPRCLNLLSKTLLPMEASEKP